MVESTTEAKTAKAEGEPGPMCVGFWQGWELQELGQALLDALVHVRSGIRKAVHVLGSKLFHL